mmetsp:Transcript_71272/g.230821  ORF Transcript_71272/g.230821 Transcript_71272/m.230821 type:complete len:307 (-) Transcript_71272:268-1188(-)
MSTARFGRKWADVDEEDEEGFNESPKAGATRFETPADKDGIKTVIEYLERDGKTYKVSKKVKQTTVKSWTNKNITARKTMAKFGKPLLNEAGEKHLVVKSEEDVNIELSKKIATQVSVKDDAEEKFYEESLELAQNLTKEKKVWTDMNRVRQMERDEVGVTRDTLEEKPAEGAAAAASTAPAAGAAAAGGAAPTKYVPPSLRGNQGGKDGGKGGGKGMDMQQQQEASLRITNLSEDVREGDLQDLFGQFGRLQRVYLAKDMVTFQSRGFAFVTYYSREDAQRAIDKLNGHGYDNLILQVQFAKPRA